MIVLETKASKGNRSRRASPKARRAAMASKVPDPFRTGPRRRTPQSSTERSAPRPRSMARSRRPSRSPVPRGVHHRAVDAEAHVTVTGWHDAAKTGTESARHARLHRELGGNIALGAQRPDRLEHRGRPACVHRRLRVTVQLAASSSVTSARRPTEPSSVTTCGWPAKRAAAWACAAVRKPRQNLSVARAPPASTAAGPPRFRRPRAALASRRPAGGSRCRAGPPGRARRRASARRAARVPGPTASSRKSSATPSASARARA